MKIVTQDFENVAKLFEGKYQRYQFQQTYRLSSYLSDSNLYNYKLSIFIGNQTILKDDEKGGDESTRLLQELKRIGFQDLYSIFIDNWVNQAEVAWDLDFSDLTSIGVPHIKAKMFVKAVEKDVSGIYTKKYVALWPI